jgi:hypothetical protein
LLAISFVMVAEKIGSETLSQIVQMVNDASRLDPFKKLRIELLFCSYSGGVAVLTFLFGRSLVPNPMR